MKGMARTWLVASFSNASVKTMARSWKKNVTVATTITAACRMIAAVAWFNERRDRSFALVAI